MVSENVISVNMSCEKSKQDALKIVTKVTGVEKVTVDMQAQTLTVIGDVDPYRIVCSLKRHKRFRGAFLITSMVTDGKAISELKGAAEKDADAASKAKKKSEEGAEAAEKAKEAAAKAKEKAEKAAEEAEKAKACWGDCNPSACKTPCCGDCKRSACESPCCGGCGDCKPSACEPPYCGGCGDCKPSACEPPYCGDWRGGWKPSACEPPCCGDCRGDCKPSACKPPSCGDYKQKACQSETFEVFYIMGDENPNDWLRFFGI